MADIREILELSERNRRRALEVVRESGLVEAWESVGAEARQVGSLRMDLMAVHRDIDYHIYSDNISVGQSFAAVTRMAANPAVKRVEYANLLDTEEECIEWHAWYEDRDGQLWQLDMIHIRKGSFFDGYVEKVADRIVEVLTPEMREAVLKLKYETPGDMDIKGIAYYRAVIEGGVRDFQGFLRWLKANPVSGTQLWMPGEPME